MIKYCILIAFIYVFPKSASCQDDSVIHVGKKFVIYSKVLKETRTFSVYRSGQSNDSTPVIYVLDGEEHFVTTAAMVNYLVRNEDKAPTAIVVGIWNTDRNRDFTPSYDSTNAIKNAGGSYQFTNFLKRELFPFIENKYNVGSNRILIGHSFGGLFGITTLTKFPELFNSYILIDPSFWWHKQKIIKELLIKINGDKYSKKMLFISIANTLPKGWDTLKVKSMNMDSVAMTSEFYFIDKLRLETHSKIIWASRYFNTENHWTVPLLSIYEGLRFVYKNY